MADRTRARTLVDLVAGLAAADPGRPALVVGETTTTYGELEAAVGRAAANLAAAGVEPGSRLALVDDATLGSVAALLAAARVGAACALMNPRLTVGELAALVEVAEADAVGVAGPAYAEALREAGVARVLGDEDVLADVAPVGPSAAPDPAAEAAVLFTSGTTGRPKPVPLAHGVLGPRVAAFAPSFRADVAPSVALMCVPLVHIGGMLGLLVALSRGDTNVVQHRFDAGEWLALVARHRVNTVFVVPTMLHRILEHPDFSRTDLHSLVAISYGAAPAPPELIRRAMAALPWVAFMNTFGQTETLGSITTLMPEDHGTEKLTSVGRPMPGVEIRIVDPVSGADVSTGTVGELWVKTEASVLPAAPPSGPAPPPGWLRTGDMVSADDDGYLYPAGRLSDTINRGGEKFAPLEIEVVLREHPAVADVAVGGVPDEEMGNRVGVAVVLRSPATADELRSFCRGKLANFKLPERVVFVDDIPYNDFGKVSRKELAALLAEAG
ncbi:MAG TPA: AMP-binding protein [Acidimicrobiales bacterium]|nr:AMP-binding protein [Acidimicrobiales bacterium]